MVGDQDAILKGIFEPLQIMGFWVGYVLLAALLSYGFSRAVLNIVLRSALAPRYQTLCAIILLVLPVIITAYWLYSSVGLFSLILGT